MNSSRRNPVDVPSSLQCPRPVRTTVLLAWGLGVLALGGCASHPVAVLSGVVVNGQLATGPAMERVQVIRSDQPVPASSGMLLRKGDTISTTAGTEAVLIFDEEWELGMDAQSVVYISNPKAWLKRGRIFVKKLLEQVRKVLEVEDGQHVLAASGTEFILVKDAESMVISVLDGSVEVKPKEGDWGTVTYGPLEQGRLTAGNPPERMPSLSAGEAEELRAFVQRVESITTLRVPELGGMQRDAAVALLNRTGLRVGRISTRLTGQSPEGAVISQTPLPGVEVRAGAEVALIVEGRGVRVPGVVGINVDAARRALTAAGLNVSVQEVETAEQTAGTVLSQSRDPRALVEPGTRVELRVAATPRVSVPNLVGRTLAEARRTLSQLGLEMGNVTQRQTLERSPGVVLEQGTSPRARIPRGSPVTLVVAVRPDFCVVPDLGRRTEDQAREMIAAAGLVVGEVRYFPDPPLRVTHQSPDANARVRCDSRVDFDIGTIGTGPDR